MTLTEEQVAEIRARVEAATPGPWRLYGVALKEQDVDFLDHARDDIPALLSALEAANKRAAEAEALLKDANTPYTQREIGNLVFDGNSVSFWRDKAKAYGGAASALRARVAELEAAVKLAAEMLTKASLCYAERIDEGLSVIRRALKGGVSEPSAPSEWQKRGPDFNEWEIEWERFAAMLADAKGEYFWMYDGALKYLNIRLDTRSNAFILRDRADNRIDPARVEAAIRQCRDKRGGVVKIDRDGRLAALKGASNEQ